MLGTDSLKKVLVFVLHLANKIDEVTQDGVTWTDGLALLPNLVEGIGVLKNGKDAYQEFLDLDEVERADVLAFVQGEFDIEDDDLEDVVEAAFNLIIDAGELIETIKTALDK